MKYLVTGGEGYVGRHVVKWLVANGNDVIVATRRDQSSIPGAKVIKLDILQSTPAIYDASGRPDVLIDLAWEDGFKHASPKHLGNLSKHIEFIHNMLEGGLRHVVGLGTMHEIGYHVGPIDEFTPTFPMNAYGIAKDHLRRVQDLYCKQFEAVNQWIRCFYIYGEDELNNSIFTKLLEAEKNGHAEFSLNSGELLYDFIDVAELGAQIGSVASQREVTGVINCCSGDPTSLKSMVLRFVEDRNMQIKLNWGGFPLRTYDSRAVWGDRKKLDQALRSAQSFSS
ncbi:NAD-dependent epimerase/dehydratase family protein [Rhizobium puerariae]|uniref:NAD-dependent epimerase/dehydratase family protein n=1 Tax=Rhizobium puerariae TaxID=1585791 RepID=A0ABV6ARG1_9HYPH